MSRPDPLQAELRTLLLDFALEVARKAVEQVENSDLDFGRINEHLDVAGTDWHVCVRYWTEEEGLLKIDGHPHPKQEELPEGLPPQLAQLFGMGDESTNGSFEFAIPRAWLPDKH